LKAKEEVAHLPLLGRKVFEAPRLLEIGLLRPVKRKPVQESGVPPVAPHFEEVLLEALIGLLEERQQHPPNDTIEANPQLLARALRFKEVEEHVH